MRFIVCKIVVLVLIGCVLLNAQEVKYLDLTTISPQTQPRYSLPSVGDGVPDARDPHALAIYLERVTPTDINPAQPFEAQFKVLNTGLAPIELPVSPRFSDLRPSDSVLSHYFVLALVVRVTGVPQGPEVGATYASVELYGSTDCEGTMLVIKPGERIRVRANVKLRKWPLEPVDVRFRGEFWFHKNTFQMDPGGVLTEGLHTNHTPTPWITVHLFRPNRDQQQQ